MQRNLLLSSCLLLTLLAFVFPAEGTMDFMNELRNKQLLNLSGSGMSSSTSALNSVIVLGYTLGLLAAIPLLIATVIFWKHPVKQKPFIIITLIVLLLLDGLIFVGSRWPITSIYLNVDGKVVVNGLYRIPLNTYFYVFLSIPLLLGFSLQGNRHTK